jgi:hypothetical protein
VSKPEYQNDSGSSAGGDLFATGTTPGLKAARARIRLRHGTLEPVVSMQRERHKRETPARPTVPMRGTGTERSVVALKSL